MKTRFEEKNGESLIRLEGELDHHAAKECMAEIGRMIDARLPMKLTLDMGGVSFMDSSGIAVILSAYKRVGQFGGSMTLSSLNPQAEKVIYAAGINKMLPVSKN